MPKGVKVGVWSVNGGVSVDGATSEVRARHRERRRRRDEHRRPGPGEQRERQRPRDAWASSTGDQDLDFTTVNGSVIAEFAGDIDADIELCTVNGRFQTDWPVTITGRIDPRHLRATLGKGGRRSQVVDGERERGAEKAELRS